jgi:hypothetical protein
LYEDELILSQHADGNEVPKHPGSEKSSDLVVWLYTGEFLASGCLMTTSATQGNIGEGTLFVLPRIPQRESDRHHKFCNGSTHWWNDCSSTTNTPFNKLAVWHRIWA